MARGANTAATVAGGNGQVAIEWLPIATLRIDPSYQRKLDKAWVAAQVAQFDPDAIGVLAVSLREDGQYYTIDGQHRTDLVRKALGDDQRVPCLVFRGLTVQDEAQKFIDLNRKRNIRVFDKFRSRIAAGEAKACAIQKIVADAGLALGEHKSSGQIAAVRALESVYDGARIGGAKAGPQALARTLRILVEAWGRDAANFEGHIVEGLGQVVITYGPKVDDRRLADALRKIEGGPAGLLGKAKALMNVHVATLSRAVGGYVVERYNYRLTVGKLKGWWA